MKPFLSLLAPAALLAAIFVLLVQVEPFSAADPVTDSFLFEVKMDAPRAGSARLFYDRGAGLRQLDSSAAKVQTGAQTCRFLVPPGEYVAFRLGPLDSPAAVTIHDARIVSLQGREVRRFAGSEWSAGAPGARLESRGEALVIDGFALLRLDRVLVLHPSISPATAAFQFVVITTAVALLLWKVVPRFAAFCAVPAACARRWLATARAHPRAALFASGALAVLVSCHPIIYAGRSFVSPNNRAFCLYDEFPTVPGSPTGPIEDPKGSDMGALMWEHLPYSVIEHRAIFQDHELPLWNRFNGGGVTLLGQSLSMIGDPLHWITILAGGAAWAWDVKFLLAKLLFTSGVGLLAWEATRRLGISALLGASSAFLGFFAYRFNHPAFFSLCYAPWILFAWLGLARSGAWREGLRWMLLIVAATWVEFQSGTAKEATMLIAGLNFAGGLVVLVARDSFSARARRLALGAGGVVLFVLLSAPCWMVFLDALSRAYTAYDQPHAYQIQPSLFLGLFDDLFYRQTMQFELHTNPSANFFVLLGLLWAVANARRLARNRTCLALVLGALPPLALAFGVVPPKLIESLPFLGKISHVDNTFSCVAMILFFPIAAIGLQACRERMASREWHGDWAVTLALLALLAAAYFGGVQAVSRADSALPEARAVLPGSPFFHGYAAALFAAVVLLPLAARRLFHLRTGRLAAALVAALALAAMHFRHGMYLETKFDAYVANPQARVDLAARSPAVTFVARHSPEPVRVAGLEGVLVAGFGVLYGFESFSGPDAVLNAQYHELLEAAHVPITWGWRHLGFREQFGALRPIYDLLNVRWWLGATGDPRKSIAGLKLVGTNDLDVFESPTVWPRAFYTDRLSTYGSVGEFAALIGTSDGRPLAAVQRSGPGAPPGGTLPAEQAGRTVIPATGYQLTGNTTEFQIDAPAPGLAVLGEAWLEGDFRVTIDGQPASYFRVNHAFRGVWLPAAGHHLVHFSYWPRRLTAGLWVAGIGAVFLAAALVLALRRSPVERIPLCRVDDAHPSQHPTLAEIL